MPDIFEIPGLQEVVNSFAVPDEEDEYEEAEGAEVAAEADGDSVPEGNGEQPGREGEYTPSQESSPLDVALAAAIAEQQAATVAIKQVAALQQLRANEPQLLAFEDLEEDQQDAVIAEANRAGVDPQTVLYTHYSSQRDKHLAEVSQLDTRVARDRQEAFDTVGAFVHGNGIVAAMPEAERSAFIASIGQLEAVSDIEPLAQLDPKRWARSVIRIASERIASVAAQAQAKDAGKQATSAMKASMGAEGAKSPAASKVLAPQERVAQFVLNAVASNTSWDKRLKSS